MRLQKEPNLGCVSIYNDLGRRPSVHLASEVLPSLAGALLFLTDASGACRMLQRTQGPNIGRLWSVQSRASCGAMEPSAGESSLLVFFSGFVRGFPSPFGLCADFLFFFLEVGRGITAGLCGSCGCVRRCLSSSFLLAQKLKWSHKG